MRRHPGFLTSFAASVSSTLWQHNNSPVACSLRSASTNTTSTKRGKLSHAASASGTTPSSPPATTVAPSSVNVPLKTDDGASQIMTDNQPLPTQKSEETPKAVDLSQILARCLAHLVLPHGGRAVSGAALPSASQHRGAAPAVAVILCTWPSNTTLGDKRIILRDLSSGARLTTTSTALHSTYAPWFEQLYPPTGASATPVCSVWLVPNFATENGVAIQAFLRDGVQRRADLSNDAMIKNRNTKTTASSTSSPPDDSSVATAIRKLLPEGHRVVISMRQLISNSRTPSSVNSNWHLRTEDNCIDLLTFATTHWTIADWEAFTPNNSVLSTWSTQNTTVPKKISNSKQQLSTTSAASLPQRKGTVAPLTATTAPAVTSMPQQSAAKASTPLASPPTTAAAAAGRAAASLSPEVIKIYEEISAIVGAATGHHSAQRHIDVYVVSTLRGALHVCPFGQTTAVPAETLLDTLKRGKGGGATMVVSPVFLATSEQSLELLKEKALLQHNTFTAAAAATTPLTTTTTTTASVVHHYTPLVLRLCDVEYSVHRAKLGNKPAEATAAPPPTTNTTNAAGVAPLTDWNRFKIDRQYLFKAIGVVRLLDIARSQLSRQEWRSVIRRGSDLATLKSLDVDPNKLESAKKDAKTQAHIRSIAALSSDTEEPLYPQPSGYNPQPPKPIHKLTTMPTKPPPPFSGLKTAPSTTVGYALDHHFKQLFQSPSRKFLELAALREHLPSVSTDDAGSDTSATNKSTSTAAATSSSRHVLCVVVHSAGAQHLGRKDNPFFEGNFVRRVEAAAVRYVEEDSAKSPFEFMQRRTARTMFSTSKTYTPEVLENHWRQRESVCGDKAVFLTPAQVVVMADPKRGLTLLRKDPLFLEMFFRPPPPPPAGAPQQSDSSSSSSSSSSSLLPRIWCVLYAQFILSGFRVKYETVAEVAKVYPPMPLTTNSTTPPSDTDLLAYLYEQQVAAGATGRVLLSIRERMEGLLASTVMEVNGVAVADTETVDNVLREIQTEKASVDLVLSEHAGKWFVDTARTNFNWQSQSDVAAVLYGGGLLKLMKGQRSAPTTTAQPLSSNAIGTAIKKPLLHRYLLESFGVDRGAVTVAQAGGIFSPNGDIQSLPPYEMYRTDNLTPSERIAALTFITQRTTVVAISLRMIGDRIAFASLFIPAGPECGGGQLIAARIIGDDGRPLATAAASTKQETCVLHAAFKQGIVPDVKSNEKVTALMSLVEFRDAIRNNALLKTLRNLSCAVTLDTTSAEATAEEDEEAPDGNDDGNDGAKAKPPTRSLMNRRKIQRENSTLDGHALERIASLPPNVVFVYSNDEAQKQVVYSIESCIVQAVCDALEIVDDERVSFVPAQAMAVQIEATNNSSLNGGGVSAGAAASVPNFAQDFEELEKSSSGESANAAAVWLQQVLGVHETVPMSKANIYPGVFGGQPSTTTQVGAAHSISYSVLMQRALESLHKQMVERWISTKAASSHPYINLDTQLSTSLPRKWLRNHSAMMHPQQLLYREGYLWESIRTSFSGPRHAKKRAELCDEVVAITTRFGTSDVQRDSGAVTSVNSSVLERLSELWKNNGMDDALLAALVQHRSTAKVIQLFAPERLLRCGMKAEATAKVNTIHAHIAHQNTNTGRLASQTPCIHNLPKNVMVRNLFTSRFGADSGMLIEADYSQLEVVTLALLAGDTQMIKELRDSVDFHCLRVSLITKEPYADVVRKAKKEKDPRYVSLRQQAKVFSFQRQYGAGSAALSSTTGMSIAEIEALIAAEDAHYPQLTEYYRHVGVSAGMSAASIIQSYRPDMMMKRVGGSPFADARLTNLRTAVEPPKYYPVVTGTKFDFSLKSDIPTLKNHPVQGFAGELVQIACGRLSRHLTSSPLLRCPTTGLHRAFLTNSVHDCVWIDCHRDVADVVEKLVKEDMESICTTLTTTFWRGDESLLANYLSEDERAELLKQQQLSGGAPWWQPDLPFPVTVHRGKNLGELLD